MKEGTSEKVVQSSAGDAYDDDVMKEEETKLERAFKLKDEANAKYNAKDYQGAIYLYHRCLLFARSVQQLSQFSLEGLARLERAKQNVEGTVADVSTDLITVEDNAENKNCTFNSDNLSDSLQGKGDGVHRKRLNSTIRGEEMKREAAELVLKCYNNLAACIINGPSRKAADYLRAVEYCDKVLVQDEKNEKALFRKGSAFAKANQHEHAISTLKLCNNREAKTLIAESQRVLNEERRRRDDQIRRNFARNREIAQERNEDAMQNPPTAMNGTVAGGVPDDQPPS